MTEIQRYEPQHTDVDSWTGVMPDIVQLAEHIAMTEFVPKGLRGKPAAVAAAILAGREQGIGPMTALTHMHVVDGRPTMSAELKRARVLAAGHEIAFDEMTVTRCVIRGRRRGQDTWTVVSWSIDDAKRANLLGKDNWRKHPRRMLQARATSELCDLLFPDVVGGLPTTEEVGDDGGDYTDATATAPTGERAKRRTAQRKKTSGSEGKDGPAEPMAQAPAEGSVRTASPAEGAAPRAVPPPPPLPGEEGYDAPPVDTPTQVATLAADDASEVTEPELDQVAPNTITKPQLTKLGVLFSKIGWGDRDERLRAASTIVGRPLLSSKELTLDEASTLIDTLEMVAAEPDPAGRLLALLVEVERQEGRKGDGKPDGTPGADVVDAEIVEDSDSDKAVTS